MFYIKKLTLLNEKGSTSTLDLDPGLNIIYGRSNTGKSMIVDCIDYMLGAKEHRFDTKLGIKKIILLIDVDGKNLTMSREVDSNNIEVSGDVVGIDNGTYKIGNVKKNNSNSVWLHLMGIDDSVQVINTLAGKPQQLTVRTFYHIFLIDEQRVQGFNSILASSQGYNKKVGTPALTSLLYLATGNNYLPDKAPTDPKIKKAKKAAVKDFVNRSMADLANKRLAEVSDNMKEDPEELQDKINLIIDEIGAAEGKLDEALNQSREQAEKIIDIDNQIGECHVLKNRNEALQTQYESDIKRLIFIAEGDIYSGELPSLDHCPFCSGEVPEEKVDSCIDAAVAEVSKIEIQIKDLKSVQHSLENEVNELIEFKQSIIMERRKVDNIIRGELRPQIQELRSNLSEYTLILKQHKAKEMIDSFSAVLAKQLEATEAEESTTFQFNLKGKVQDVFSESLTRNLKELLESCNYKHFANLYFDLDECDVIVNGHLKKSQGKGFRAFLNTILAIAIQNCLDEYNLYGPRMLVIDSPILSLKEKEDNIGEEKTSESMKTGLFKYFLSHQKSRQTIIIENEIPNLNYSNAHLIEFTKDFNEGRYGLIEWYKD